MLLSIELSRLHIESFFLPFHSVLTISWAVGLESVWWFESKILFASIFGLVLEMSRGTELVVESFLVIDTRRISFNSYVTIHSEVALFFLMS